MKRWFIGVLVFFIFLLSLSYNFSQSSEKAFALGNLVGWWKLDETSGNSVDSSGSGLTLTNSNVTYSTGQIDGAASFNGSTSGFTGTGPNLANSSFSISAWLYANNLNADQVWFNLGSASSTNQALHLRLTTTGALRFGFFINDLTTTGGVFSAGAWHNVIYTYDSSTRARIIYVDGVQKGNNTASANFSGNTVLSIGSWRGAERWNGKIDDIKIYNRVLNGTEVTELAAGGGGPDVPTPTSTNTPTPTYIPVNPTSTVKREKQENVSSKPSCTSISPIGAPKLFHISPDKQSATLFFVPLAGQNTGYIVSYGLNTAANQYATSFNYGMSSGAISYKINSLFKGTWYFRVSGINGCMPGPWSQTVSVAVS